MPACGKPGTEAAKNSSDYSVDDEENEGKDDAAGDCSRAYRAIGYVVIWIAGDVGDEEDGRVVDDSGDEPCYEAQPPFDDDSTCDEACDEADEQADKRVQRPVAEDGKTERIIDGVVKIGVVFLIGGGVREHDDEIY